MTISWKLISVKLRDLKKHPKNPRRLSREQYEHLEKSLDKFGLIDKPIINTDFQLIGGHQRYEILKKQKVKEIECWMPDNNLSEEDIQELMIRLNRNHGEWDFEILANEFNIPDLLDYGFSPEDLDIGNFETIENETEEDSEVLEPCKDEDAITKLGDIIELNEHRLVCGDCLDPLKIADLLNSNEIDMVYTDPPYGLNVKISDGKKHGKALVKRNKFNSILNDDSTSVAIDSFNLCLSMNIPIMIWWGANYFPEVLPPSSCWIIWDKNTGSNDFADAELAWCSDKSAIRIFKHTWSGMIKDSEHGQKRVHPTQKPIALAEWCIKKYGKDTKNILDLFVGSGSTLIACEKLNKIFFGMELSPAYCDIIIDRWKRFMEKSGKECTINRNGEII